MSKQIYIFNPEHDLCIAGYISRDTLTAIREDLISILADKLVGHYEGFLGIDQMIS